MVNNFIYQPISVVNVYYKGFGVKCLIGQLTIDGRHPVFGYDAAWIANDLELSPIEMPLCQCHPLFLTRRCPSMRCNLSSSANSYPTDMLLETKKWDPLKKAKRPILLL